jgi:hypothetical protein
MVSDRRNGINRGVIAALIGLALVGTGDPPKQETKPEQAKAAKPEPQRSPTVAAKPTKAIEVVHPAKQEAPCGPHRYRSNDDLCAQWKAADSASDAAYWAWWQTLLSLAGIVGLLFSLYYTRKAVTVAEEATKDADNALLIATRNADAAFDATKAMQRQNQITEAAQRPWIAITAELLKFEILERGPRDLWFECKITFTNIGQMAAMNFEPSVKYAAMGPDFLDEMKGIMDGFSSAVEEIDSVLVPRDINVWPMRVGQQIESLPWHTSHGREKTCRLIVIAMARYRLPSEVQWRYAMQCFSIAEKVDEIDDSRFRYDFPTDLSLSAIHIRKLGRSRAT